LGKIQESIKKISSKAAGPEKRNHGARVEIWREGKLKGVERGQLKSYGGESGNREGSPRRKREVEAGHVWKKD